MEGWEWFLIHKMQGWMKPLQTVWRSSNQLFSPSRPESYMFSFPFLSITCIPTCFPNFLLIMEKLLGRNLLRFCLCGFDPHVVTQFGSVSRLVLGAHGTINIASREEERVGHSFLNPFVPGSCSFVTFLEVLMRNILLRFLDSSRCSMFNLCFSFASFSYV